MTSAGLRRLLVLLLALLPGACHHAPPANPHYVLGRPWQAGGVWFYPRENYELVETGLAIVYPSGHDDLTANGETFDQRALAAAHRTLQLPSIARLTNLDTGRQVVVRINDRGPPTPGRMLEVTQRTATLLGMPASGASRVRLEVMAADSHAAADAVPGGPQLAVTAAPRAAVQETGLGPPGSAALSGTSQPTPSPTPSITASPVAPRLAENVLQTAADPGHLYVRLGTFQNFRYAEMQRAQVAGTGASIVSTYEGRARTFRVLIGPFAGVQQADTVLDQVLRAGVTDAGIVVE